MTRFVVVAFLVIPQILNDLAEGVETDGGLPMVTGIDFQPIGVHVNRLREALDYLGEPLSEETVKRLDEALAEENEALALKMVQQALDPLCLLDVQINPESRVKVHPGPTPRLLMKHGWSVFLIKVRKSVTCDPQGYAASWAGWAG